MRRRDFLLGAPAAVGAFLFGGNVALASEPRLVPVHLQQRLLESESDLALYGGAAGGGKTAALYDALLQRCDRRPRMMTVHGGCKPYLDVYFKGRNVACDCVCAFMPDTPRTRGWGWVDLLVTDHDDRMLVDGSGNLLIKRRYGVVWWERMAEEAATSLVPLPNVSPELLQDAEYLHA